MNMRKLLYSIGVPVLLLFSFAGFAQDKIITGRVTDSIGNGIANVSITVKEAPARGTTSASDGRFSISVPANATALVFSSVGYAYREVPISGTTVNVSLQSTASDLNTVVVIGYGTVRKKDLTGSVATVSAKDFQKGVITTPEQLIAGKVAGVSITPNNGAPGSGSTIRIRGGSSLNASNDPLIVIDGMPLTNSDVAGVANALALLNPNDIASFSILKDASATAIYGSRASNGVILITTKKGVAGKPKFSFTTQVSAGMLAKKFPVLNTTQFRNLVNTYGNANQKALLGSANTDWQDEIYQTAISTDNNISVTGSYKQLPYRLSLGYLHQTGILKTGYLNRISPSLNLNPTLLDNHLKIDFSARASFSKSRFANEDAVWGANQFDPTQPVYSKSNRYGGYWERLDPLNTLTGLAALSPKNPVGLLNQKNDIGYANRLITNANIDYKLHFFPDLHAIVNAGYDYSRGHGNVVWDDSAASVYRSYTTPGTTIVHSGSRTQYKKDLKNWFGNFYFNYTKSIDAKNRVEAMAGIEYQDYLTINYGFNELAGDTAIVKRPKNLIDKPEYRIFSYLARVNYSFNNMLYITGSFRRDASSRFAPDFRWSNYPSGAIAWSISELPGLKNSKALNLLKLRFGYGVTGQQEGIDLYDYISYYDLSDVKAQYQFGNNFYQMYRPGGYYYNRKWEQTATTNLGVDYGFFNNRFSGSVEVYYRKTSDLLNRITQPAFTNFANTIIANVGNMENKGVEFTTNVTPIKSRNLTWDLSFNATYNENKVTKLDINGLPNYINQVAGIGGLGGVIANAVGYPRGSFFVFKQVYDKSTGRPIENLYEDQNRDGLINNSDLILFKSSIPKWFFGFSTNLNYKKWSAAFTMRANVGNYMYNNVATNGAISKFLFSSYLANQSNDVLNTYFEGQGYFYQSNYYVQNASFLKMDNVNLGYNMGRISRNVNLRLTASAQNVFTITKYKGLDPEISGGIDNNGYPRPRTITIGAGLDF